LLLTCGFVEPGRPLCEPVFGPGCPVCTTGRHQPPTGARPVQRIALPGVPV